MWSSYKEMRGREEREKREEKEGREREEERRKGEEEKEETPYPNKILCTTALQTNFTIFIKQRHYG